MTASGSSDPVRDLLTEALDRGVGVAFEPSGEGWRISYITPYRLTAFEDVELRGGALADAEDLDVAAGAALAPLREVADQIDEVGESEA